jgi:hypothetical protein
MLCTRLCILAATYESDLIGPVVIKPASACLRLARPTMEASAAGSHVAAAA